MRAPLRLHPKNPRYFTDDGRRAIYLTGSHTWSNLQDMGASDPPAPFDFSAYLDFLKRHHHNFIRLWRWEPPRWRYPNMKVCFCQPHPWMRTGPGTARDGKPKFNLNRFDEAYFQRLRERVQEAARRDIYVSIMLFEGHSLKWAEEAWEYHPFHPDNNVNGINAGHIDYYTLKRSQVLALQEAYVRRVIDTVNDLHNVLYEVCNEAGEYSTEWQYHFIRFIKQYEGQKGQQHPVGMTFQWGEPAGTMNNLFRSPADWISPSPDGGYRDDPPANDWRNNGNGRKVVLNDTDHLWGEGGDPQWVWKTFTRGHHPLFMDRIVEIQRGMVVWQGQPGEEIPNAQAIRKAMGVTRQVASQMRLAETLPLPELASSRYCLAAVGKQYVVYLPEGGEVVVDLSGAQGLFQVQWVHPVEGNVEPASPVQGGGPRSLKAPFEGDAAAVLQAG